MTARVIKLSHHRSQSTVPLPWLHLIPADRLKASPPGRLRRDGGGTFSERDAAVEIALDRHAGRCRSLREYAMLFGWGEKSGHQLVKRFLREKLHLEIHWDKRVRTGTWHELSQLYARFTRPQPGQRPTSFHKARPLADAGAHRQVTQDPASIEAQHPDPTITHQQPTHDPTPTHKTRGLETSITQPQPNPDPPTTQPAENNPPTPNKISSLRATKAHSITIEPKKQKNLKHNKAHAGEPTCRKNKPKIDARYAEAVRSFLRLYPAGESFKWTPGRLEMVTKRLIKHVKPNELGRFLQAAGNYMDLLRRQGNAGTRFQRRPEYFIDKREEISFWRQFDDGPPPCLKTSDPEAASIWKTLLAALERAGVKAVVLKNLRESPVLHWNEGTLDVRYPQLHLGQALNGLLKRHRGLVDEVARELGLTRMWVKGGALC